MKNWQDSTKKRHAGNTVSVKVIVRRELLERLEAVTDDLGVHDVGGFKRPSLSTVVNAAIKTGLEHRDEMDSDVTDVQRKWRHRIN